MTSPGGPPSDPNGMQPPVPEPGYGQAGQTPPMEPADSSSGTATGPSGTHTTHRRPEGFDQRGRVKRGRVSTTWIGLIAAAIVLILLIIFIAQNLDKPTIHFLGLRGHFPLGLALLIAAIGGILLAAIPGSVRIFQLRRALKRNTPMSDRVPDRQ